jgi:hypothetical protein
MLISKFNLEFQSESAITKHKCKKVVEKCRLKVAKRWKLLRGK